MSWQERDKNSIAKKTVVWHTAGVVILFIGIIVFSRENVIAPTATNDNLPIVSAPRTVTLVAVGDILLTRSVGARIDEAEDPNLPFENLSAMLSEADIAFGNLECPLDRGEQRTHAGLIFKCPIKYVPGLTAAGFDVLSIANNHTLDQGTDNIDFTIEYLKSVGIMPVGTSSSSTSPAGVAITRNGTSFGFLAYSYTARNDGGRSQHPQVATMEDLKQLETQISNLKTRSDIVVVSMHAGTEYVRRPHQEQIDFAHAAIDAGADVVLGHHPHWIQTIEIYKDKPIFYSLGNFVFDQMWSQDTKEGLLVKFQITNNKLQMAELVPVIIENFCCPRLATPAETESILRKINATSAEIKF